MSLAFDFNFKKLLLFPGQYAILVSMMKDVRRDAMNIVVELTTHATMSMELVTWAVILATRTKLATRVSDIVQTRVN